MYAGCGTWFTVRLGKPLVGLNFSKEHLCGNFRYALVRFRENAESIALFGGEPHEEKEFLQRYGAIVKNSFSFLRQNLKLNLWLNFYSNAETLVPALVMAPGFFAGRFKLGIFMQVTSAFNQVHTSLSFFVQSYMTIAHWQAITQRLVAFETFFQEKETSMLESPRIQIAPTTSNSFSAAFKEICLPEGRCLLKNISLGVAPGESILIQGASGVGKSTLLKAMCGLWPYGQGQVDQPEGLALVLCQKPYLPLGTLKEMVSYPSQEVYDDKIIKGCLQEVGLGSLIPLLHERQNWHHSLSLGEQQRLNFARLLLQRPQWIIMDESTSGLDEASEGHLLSLLRAKLPGAGIISIGHRSTLQAFHGRLVVLTACKEGSA